MRKRIHTTAIVFIFVFLSLNLKVYGLMNGPAVSIDVLNIDHTISDGIYGYNFAGTDDLDQLDIPINRWGGNATTRYNWEYDSTNRASDWYYENIPNTNSTPGDLPDGSSSDRFIEKNNLYGVDTILTIPMIGYVAKDRAGSPGNYNCAYPVNAYGAQQSVDPWLTNCGNGVLMDGTQITWNDLSLTSIAVDESYVQAWVDHLVPKYGSANTGGVRYYNLDNEPMLWNSTHRDIHNSAVGYDEIYNRTIAYASAIKTADPGAQTLGPVVWGWTAYFWSSLDQAPGGNWWSNPQDRNAHGGTPFLEWYLQQMQAYENENSVRLLDYLDIHYYPQASVSLRPAGDAATQARRLRTTRSLWDPTYVDESWISDTVMLVPRMKLIIENNYPGTKLAITEYNYGGLEHINGALTQADVLGIYGREGVDIATLWDSDVISSPGAFAFKMYRNYDGTGSKFGDQGLSAVSTDQSLLSVFASRRQSDSVLTVMFVNKAGDDLGTPVTLTGLSGTYLAEVYTYSANDINNIIHSTTNVSSNFDYTFENDSITLFVIDDSIELPTPTPMPTKTQEEVLISIAKSDLANRLGVAENTISIVGSNFTQWSDGCLGIKIEGIACAQVIVPGYEIILRVNLKVYEYRTTMAYVVYNGEVSTTTNSGLLKGTSIRSLNHGLNLLLNQEEDIKKLGYNKHNRFQSQIGDIVNGIVLSSCKASHRCN